MTNEKQQEFLELYEPIHDRFERFCRARVYGNMEFRDLMNEALLVAFENFESLKSKEAFLSYLFSISVHILSNNHRKKKEYHAANYEHIKWVKDESSNTEMDAEIHFLYEALSKLNDAQRESIILFEISGFSIKEIAKIQGASVNAVKQRLKRGRDRLAEIMTFESSYKTGKAV